MKLWKANVKWDNPGSESRLSKEYEHKFTLKPNRTTDFNCKFTTLHLQSIYLFKDTTTRHIGWCHSSNTCDVQGFIELLKHKKAARTSTSGHVVRVCWVSWRWGMRKANLLSLLHEHQAENKLGWGSRRNDWNTTRKASTRHTVCAVENSVHM